VAGPDKCRAQIYDQIVAKQYVRNAYLTAQRTVQLQPLGAKKASGDSQTKDESEDLHHEIPPLSLGIGCCGLMD
jgi:hypothetical protein